MKRLKRSSRRLDTPGAPSLRNQIDGTTLSPSLTSVPSIRMVVELPRCSMVSVESFGYLSTSSRTTSSSAGRSPRTRSMCGSIDVPTTSRSGVAVFSALTVGAGVRVRHTRGTAWRFHCLRPSRCVRTSIFGEHCTHVQPFVELPHLIDSRQSPSTNAFHKRFRQSNARFARIASRHHALMRLQSVPARVQRNLVMTLGRIDGWGSVSPDRTLVGVRIGSCSDRGRASPDSCRARWSRTRCSAGGCSPRDLPCRPTGDHPGDRRACP